MRSRKTRLVSSYQAKFLMDNASKEPEKHAVGPEEQSRQHYSPKTVLTGPVKA